MAATPKAKYVITADDDSERAWRDAFKTADKNAKRIEKVIKASFAILGGAAFFRRFGEELDDLADRADAFGSTLSAIEVQNVRDASAAFEEMNKSIRDMREALLVNGAPLFKEIADGIRTLAGGATEIEKLEDQLQFLKRTADQPFMINLGFIDGGDKVLTSDEMKAKIVEIEAKLKGLRAKPDLPDVGDGFIRLDPEVNFGRPNDLDVSASINDLFDRIQIQPLVEDLREFGELKQSILEGNQDGIADGINAAIQESDRSLQEFGDRVIDTGEKLSTFADEAFRNMQDGLAEFLFDPFDEGLDGMVKGFADTVRRMLAEAAAAKVFETLLGKKGEGGNGNNVSGLLDAILFGSYGGGKASGGPLEYGKWYTAGEHGPEPIWGGGPGAFAMGYGGGGSPININMPVDMRGASVDAVKLFMAERPRMIRQAVEIAKAEMRDGRRRGSF